MKLRNKKTGKIIEYSLHLWFWHEDNQEWYEYGNYYSIDEIKEDWEDYKPQEPLIKDEKIRKAVRAWAEANDIDRVWHECATCWLRGNGLEIYLEELDLEQGNYSIEELCGEEE